jgi:hypothetical protein
LDFVDGFPADPASDDWTASDGEFAEMVDQLEELRATVGSLYAQVKVFAIEESVSKSTAKLMDQLTLVVNLLRGGDIDVIERVIHDAVEEVSALSEAIRRDLGLAAPEDLLANAQRHPSTPNLGASATSRRCWLRSRTAVPDRAERDDGSHRRSRPPSRDVGGRE